MSPRLYRSISEPLRSGLSLQELWNGPDKGLIWCWERGRQRRNQEPDLAERAELGELVMLNWKGGVEKKVQNERKYGSLQYLAQWQGLRGEDLDIDVDGECIIECSKTGQAVVFSAIRPKHEDCE
jgi:hypothetical protein